MSQTSESPATISAPVVFEQEGNIYTNSMSVAACFEKLHKNVLRDIESILADCPAEFGRLNFEPSSYTSIQGKEQPLYNLTFDGFILLAMGYTGPKALQVKLAYIAEFNRMRAELDGKQPASLPPSDQNIIQTLVKAIADRYPQAEQKSIYMRVLMRFRNHFRLGSYKDLPRSQMAEAVAWLASFRASEPAQATLSGGMETVAIDRDMGKLLQDTLAALAGMQKEADYRIGVIQGYLQNSVLPHCSSEEKRRMFHTLKHIHNMAADSLYMTRNALAVAWNLGRGVSFL